MAARVTASDPPSVKPDLPCFGDNPVVAGPAAAVPGVEGAAGQGGPDVAAEGDPAGAAAAAPGDDDGRDPAPPAEEGAVAAGVSIVPGADEEERDEPDATGQGGGAYAESEISMLGGDPLFLVLSEFFMSSGKKGRSIADILEEINENLAKLVKKM